MEARFIAPAGSQRGSDARIIVSAGIGEKYAADFVETRQHCDFWCADVWRLYYTDYPDGCPPQNERQYAFKIFALEEAVRAGFRYILWMDSCFAPIASIAPLWEVIARKGWYVPPQLDAMLGGWCSDAALDIFGIDRAMAATIPLVYSGLVGMDMQHPVSQALWLGWKTFYRLGAFQGAHQNKIGQPMTPWGHKIEGHVSNDPSVRGHRHDESALSYVLHAMGLTPMRLGFLTLESEAGFIGHFVARHAQ
jgi:hypothetical protein